MLVLQQASLVSRFHVQLGPGHESDDNARCRKPDASIYAGNQESYYECKSESSGVLSQLDLLVIVREGRCWTLLACVLVTSHDTANSAAAVLHDTLVLYIVRFSYWAKGSPLSFIYTSWMRYLGTARLLIRSFCLCYND